TGCFHDNAISGQPAGGVYRRRRTFRRRHAGDCAGNESFGNSFCAEANGRPCAGSAAHFYDSRGTEAGRAPSDWDVVFAGGTRRGSPTRGGGANFAAKRGG